MTHKAIIVSDHAAQRLKARGITRQMVRDVLATGEDVTLAPRPGSDRRARMGETAKGLVTVIYRETATTIELVTVHFGPPENRELR